MKKSNLPVAIIGLGKTGISIAKYLNKNKIKYIAYDTRENLNITDEIKKNIDSKNIVLGKLKKNFLEFHDNFIISPGISLEKNLLSEIESSGKNIQTDIDIFNDHKRNNIVCITGSNGKTTVTLIIEHVLNGLGKKAKAGGNVGLPALELLSEDYDYNVLELSSFQLEMTKEINCKVSLITNIVPDHLDRHESFENYIDIKHRIFNKTEYIIINESDVNIKKHNFEYKFSFRQDKPNNSSSFGINKENGINYIYHGSKRILSERDVKLIGFHNLLNICSSLAVLSALNLDIDKSIEIIKSFDSIEHRMENFFNIDNIQWINDSKATNIESTISAINSLESNIILILGGKSKTSNYEKLNEALKNKVDYLILFGECKDLLNKKIKSVKNTTKAKNFEDAIKKARDYSKNISNNGKSNISILLSPACSSYDMFKSYEERGNFFKELVLNQYR